MKKLLLFALLPICAYAADEEVLRDQFQGLAIKETKTKEPQKSAVLKVLQDELDGWDEAIGNITPKSFNDYGKQVFNGYLDVWVEAAKEGGIPTDRGLAKIFVDMHNDGVDKVINDAMALKKANMYNNRYEGRASQLVKDTQEYFGTFTYDGAQEATVDSVRILRQLSFMAIMKNKAPIMPKEKLVGWCYDLSTKSALESLQLNVDNSALSPAAIRGIALLQTYLYQQDQIKKV